MKKFIVFAVSFIGLFLLLQVLSGMFLTLTFTPDINQAWRMSGNLPQETVIVGNQAPFLLTLFIAFLSATIAYFIPKLFMRAKEQQ